MKELLNEYHRAGKYSITWDASRQPSGIYFIRAFNGEHYFHKKITLLKWKMRFLFLFFFFAGCSPQDNQDLEEGIPEVGLEVESRTLA